MQVKGLIHFYDYSAQTNQKRRTLINNILQIVTL